MVKTNTVVKAARGVRAEQPMGEPFTTRMANGVHVFP